MRVDNQSISCALIVLAAALVLVFSTPRTAQAQTEDCDGWVALHDMLPRRYPVMVQTADGPLVWGGTLSNDTGDTQALTSLATCTCETWKFDGVRWRFVTISGPTPRYWSAATFDAGRNRVVLFGGTGSLGNQAVSWADTWEFVDDGWSRRELTSAPSARSQHAMVYDPVRQAVLLYGGVEANGQSTSSPFWTYDGTTWTELPLTTPNPGAQRSHFLAFDPRDNSVLLVPAGPNEGVWHWDGSTWSQGVATGVQATTVFYDQSRSVFILGDARGGWFSFAGDGPAVPLPLPTPTPLPNRDVNPVAVSLNNGNWLSVIGPTWTSALAAPIDGSFIVSEDSGWSSVATRPQPIATTYMGFGFHTRTSEYVLFGGSMRHGGPQPRETWLLRGETWRKYLGAQPPNQLYSTIVFSPHMNASLLLGGNNAGQVLWMWDGIAWTSQPTGNASSAFFTSNAAFDPTRNAVIWPQWQSFFEYRNTQSMIVTSGITTLYGTSVFDQGRGALLFISWGGSTSRLDFTTTPPRWQQVNTTNPTSGNGVGAAGDLDRGGVTLFGGLNSRTTRDADEFPRNTYFLPSNVVGPWRPIETLGTNGPIGRMFHAMSYDSLAHRVIMYGGQGRSSYPLRETWKLARGPAAVALQPVDTYVVPGQTAEAFIIASGGGVIEYQWFKDGAPLANSDRISGADSDTLQIQNFTSDDNAQYHVTVHNPCGDDQSIAVQLRAIPACPGDFNDSGGVDAADLADFFDAFERGLMLADVDLSGGIDANDLAVFIGSFQAGGC